MSLSISEDIKTVSDLKKKTNEIFKQLHNTGRPIVVTVNGKPDAILMDVDVFEKKMKDRKTKYSKSLVPPFAVYHSFSHRFYPADLDLPSRFLLVPEPFFY